MKNINNNSRMDNNYDIKTRTDSLVLIADLDTGRRFVGFNACTDHQQRYFARFCV